ncbi:ABC transporter substrate-binding protein [Stutzerimonas stutzeri]|uniref:ABC transporter substrate-binding protein n=1 Tax=Stutzerimonas stutzeri TaxID=316 RepID=A0A2S4ALC0_STUST|nr:ABC transporter substrate-binding protein [Stutzerimonas stutzeri]MCQ4261818.1 ABC transporter substrate-binding protein [Stutzerimonas stutzeri]POH82260.1 ABC transporter substrate-binding protein [Stutzerimonas stutzeri]
MMPFLPVLILFIRRARLVLLALVLLPLCAQAQELPVLTLSALQFGTPHWELEHLKRQGLDRANGFELKVRLVADVPASRLALTSGSVDGAVSDLLWAQARYQAGTAYRYVPFSSQIGEVLVPEGSAIRTLADLRGKRIGVAGGPDGLGWQLLQHAAAQDGIDLAKQATVQSAAPPLLSQALRRGQVDALLTFWHFSARMRGEGGVQAAFGLADLLQSLELDPELPVLGYLFAESWAAEHEALLQRFATALGQTKHQLANEPAHWQALRPLMRADEDGVFAALRDSFVEGIPQPLDQARIADLQRLLILTGADPAKLMPVALFQSTP